MPADLILGMAALGGTPYAGQPAIGTDECMAIIRRAYRLGITHFDTASAYGHASTLLVAALPDQACRIYSKSDGPYFPTTDYHQIVPLMHHFDGRGEVPRWAQGFSCYSHDNIRSAPGLIVQQDWNLLNQSIFPDGCSRRIARSIFLQGALAHTPSQRRIALHAAMGAADQVVIGPRSIAELEELVEFANWWQPVTHLPVDCVDTRTHRCTDARRWQPT